MTVAIGIDVGGTKIAGALIAENGDAIHQQTVPTPRSDHGADPNASATIAMITRLQESALDVGVEVVAVGVGVPEYVSPDGRITSSEVLAWGDPPSFEPVCRVPVILGADVRCAARAEDLLGHGRNLSSFLYVSIGTGISSTLVIEHQLWAGHRGEAIALGELPVPRPDAIRPSAPLTVEQQASGRAIELALDDGRKPVVDDEEVATRAGGIIASAIVTAVRLTDPAAVVLGGGLGTSSGPLTDALARGYGRALSTRAAPPPLLQSRLGPSTGVIGAGLIAHAL